MNENPKQDQNQENPSGNGSQADQCIKSFKIVSNNKLFSIDYSKNLEFSLFPQLVGPGGVSLAHIRPDVQNITPQKISLKDVKPSTNYPPPEYFKKPKERQDPYTIAIPDSQVFTAENNIICLYKFWPSQNRFFCKGRFMGGPKSDKIPNISAWAILIATTIIFFAVAFPYLLNDDTLMLPLISIYLILSTVAFFLLTSFTDPGIIPRKSIWSLDNELKDLLQFTSNKEKENTETNSPLNSPKLGPMPNLTNDLKFCPDCNFYRPKKTTHCRFCGNCVSLRYTHFHFINNCIGRRNYRYFIGFMMSLILLTICFLTSFIIIIVTAIDPESDPESFFENPDVTIVVILTLGIPVAIKILVILLFVVINLVSTLKSRRLTKKQRLERVAQKLEAGKLSVNLWHTDPSFVCPRKIITRDQYSNYKKQTTEKL